MTIKTINGLYPDENGNIFLPRGPEGPPGEQGVPGQQGIQGIRGPQGYSHPLYVNEPEKIMKFWDGIATCDSNGLWSVDYSLANFEKVIHLSTMMMAGSFTQANAPLATHVIAFNNTQANGKAFKATSAGLLAAMQQTPAEAGTQVNVMVVGY